MIYNAYYTGMAVRKLAGAQYLIRAPDSDLKRWAKAARRLEESLGVRVTLAEYIRRTMNEATAAELSKTG